MNTLRNKGTGWGYCCHPLPFPFSEMVVHPESCGQFIHPRITRRQVAIRNMKKHERIHTQVNPFRHSEQNPHCGSSRDAGERGSSPVFPDDHPSAAEEGAAPRGGIVRRGQSASDGRAGCRLPRASLFGLTEHAARPADRVASPGGLRFYHLQIKDQRQRQHYAEDHEALLEACARKDLTEALTVLARHLIHAHLQKGDN